MPVSPPQHTADITRKGEVQDETNNMLLQVTFCIMKFNDGRII